MFPANTMGLGTSCTPEKGAQISHIQSRTVSWRICLTLTSEDDNKHGNMMSLEVVRERVSHYLCQSNVFEYEPKNASSTDAQC